MTCTNSLRYALNYLLYAMIGQKPYGLTLCFLKPWFILYSKTNQSAYFGVLSCNKESDPSRWIRMKGFTSSKIIQPVSKNTSKLFITLLKQWCYIATVHPSKVILSTKNWLNPISGINWKKCIYNTRRREKVQQKTNMME